MLEFRDISLVDRERFKSYTNRRPLRQCDVSFEQLYLWRKDLSVQIAFWEDFLLIRCCYDDEVYFKFPIGGENYAEAILKLKNYCEKEQIPLVFQNVTEESCQILKDTFGDAFSYEEERDNFDYMHHINSLADYAGNRFVKKRGCCNSFQKKYSWRFFEIQPKDLELCRQFNSFWIEQNQDRLDASITDECVKINETLDLYEQFELTGGILEADGQVCAYTMGAALTEDTFDVFFEKANIANKGAYAMVCREFVRMLRKKYPSLRYINREEDMGIENLRAAKELYRPDFMLKKYTVRLSFNMTC